MDSVRAKNTSLHGYKRETTPYLKQFANGATTYQEAKAPGVDSATSHTSIFTGYDVPQHQVVSGEDTLKTGHSAWEYLTKDGFETALFTPNPFFSDRDIGLGEGFDKKFFGKDYDLPFRRGLNPRKYTNKGDERWIDFLYDSIREIRPLSSIGNGLVMKADEISPLLIEPHYNDRPASIFASEFTKWVKDQSEPWAACINFMDAHTPFFPKRKFDNWSERYHWKIQDKINPPWDFISKEESSWKFEALTPLYDASISQIDSSIGRIINHLKKEGKYDDTLIIVTSDHGEAFNDQSRVKPELNLVHHSIGIHESLLHVPLVIKYPHQNEERHVHKPVSLTDLYKLIKYPGDDIGMVDRLLDESPIISAMPSYQTRSDGMIDRLETHAPNASTYKGWAYAIYEQNGDGIRKHIQWENRSALVKIDGTYSFRDGHPDKQILEHATKLQDADVARKQTNEVTADIESRLTNLGYR